MTDLEDIISTLESNSAVITSIDIEGPLATITYVDSSGNTQSDKYTITINSDGSEDWTKI